MQQSENAMNDGLEQSHPTVDVETVGSKTLSLRVNERGVELTKTYSEKTNEEDNNTPRETTSSESIQMEIEKQSINQYTHFTDEYEGFSSSISSKTDTTRIALVEINDDGDISWHDPRARNNSDSVRYLQDGTTVWSYELTALPGVKVQKTGLSSDRHPRQTKRKVRVERQAVEAVDGRLLILKWRDGVSREDTLEWSNFKPIMATEIRMEANNE